MLHHTNQDLGLATSNLTSQTLCTCIYLHAHFSLFDCGSEKKNWRFKLAELWCIEWVYSLLVQCRDSSNISTTSFCLGSICVADDNPSFSIATKERFLLHLLSRQFSLNMCQIRGEECHVTICNDINSHVTWFWLLDVLDTYGYKHWLRLDFPPPSK